MMRYLITLGILILSLCKVESQPQRIGEWRTFTNMSVVRNAVMVGTNVWAATSGGVFVYDTIENSFTKFTNIEGLSTNDIRVIAYDGSDRIWAGADGGLINVYNLKNRQWSRINDIANKKEITRRAILSFNFKGDSVFIVSEFGVSVFRISTWNFGDTYNSQNFGFTTTPLVSSMAYWKDSIWVGTSFGIATASLSNPYSWKIYNSLGLASNAVNVLSIFRDTLLIGTGRGLSYYSNGIFTAVAGSFNGYSVVDIKSHNGSLSVLSAYATSTLEKRHSVLGASQLIISNNVQCNNIIPVSSIWLASIKGLAIWTSSNDWSYIYPYGASSNMFTDLAVDENGVLWVAPGSNVQVGFSRYDVSLHPKDQWKNFLSSGYPFGCYRVSIGKEGTVWISTWGDGVIEVKSDTIKRKLNFYSKPSLPGARVSIPAYVVSGDVVEDGNGKTWMCHRVEDNNKSLLKLDDDTTAIFYNNQFDNRGWFHTMIIDQNGTKWLAGDLPWESTGNGIYLYNEKQMLSGIQSYNKWSFLSDGLKSRSVISLAVDIDGAVWIGTSAGVNIVLNPQYPRQFSICYALQAYQVMIQTIMVDPLNNKWIGTKEGVFVLNPDGTQILQYYTVASTGGKLLSDDVLSIAMDKKNGIVYFGTQQGLSSLAIEPIQASKSYTSLKIGPNPFFVPYNNDDQLQIENLAANSTIKIMTIDGIIVRQFEAQGAGRARWDGRNKNGAFVSSGVYFIVAYAENGKQNIIGKVAVIRR